MGLATCLSSNLPLYLLLFLAALLLTHQLSLASLKKKNYASVQAPVQLRQTPIKESCHLR